MSSFNLNLSQAATFNRTAHANVARVVRAGSYRTTPALEAKGDTLARIRAQLATQRN